MKQYSYFTEYSIVNIDSKIRYCI